MMNIFDTPSDSTIALVKSTTAVAPDQNGNIMVSFTTNKGKGSGAQVLPYTEFRDAVTVLVDAATNGIPEITEDENIPAAEMVRRTLRVEDGIVSFRVKGGKGAKPARIALEDFAAVCALLQSGIDGVEEMGASLAKGAKKK